MSGGTTSKARPLLEWLLARHPDTPRTRAKQWILAGRVSVNGQVMRKPQALLADPGGTLRLLERQSTSLDCGNGWQIHPRVSLLHLDSALAIVNKEAGLVSVPSPSTDLSALSILQDFLRGQLRVADRTVGGRALPPVFRRLNLLPVHRIDQFTSGVLCVACNPVAREKLIAQVRSHAMKREYVAFVEGRPPAAKGTWRHLLSLSSDEFEQRVISKLPTSRSSEKIQEAVTHYEVVETYSMEAADAFVTKLSLRLETGLRHQIRIQAAQAGLPLVGERKYRATQDHGGGQGRLIDFPRQALHAAALTLEHPDQAGRHLTWHAPLPKDLRQLEHKLRQDYGKSTPKARGPSAA
jgi:23S rRNA pseudouridine1911/1915/1917 synthase